jgi:hypothetical protein
MLAFSSLSGLRIACPKERELDANSIALLLAAL